MRGRPAFELNPVVFEKNIERITESGCWIWVRQVNKDGYGRQSVKDKMILMHRFSWEMHKGQIPNDQQVLHNCDVRGCCNPDHLFIGTHQENMKDRDRKGRCARGKTNGISKLTEEQAREIKNDPRSIWVLGKLYGVHFSTIWHIKVGKTWKHV